MSENEHDDVERAALVLAGQLARRALCDTPLAEQSDCIKGKPCRCRNIASAVIATFRDDLVRSSEDMGRICAENAELRKALEGVVAVADRRTVEFDRARAAITRKPSSAP